VDWRIASSTRPGCVWQVGCVGSAVEISVVGDGMRVCWGIEASGVGVDRGSGELDDEQAVTKASEASHASRNSTIRFVA
jgi:hypothetical protein